MSNGHVTFTMQGSCNDVIWLSLTPCGLETRVLAFRQCPFGCPMDISVCPMDEWIFECPMDISVRPMDEWTFECPMDISVLLMDEYRYFCMSNGHFCSSNV